jgi:hypothetical protein
MTTYKTPDVYVEEISLFPPSVAEVGTAIPAFIGFTEKATKATPDDLLNRPTKVYSFAQFEQYYGSRYADGVEIAITADPLTVTAPPKAKRKYPMFYAIQMYFDNGGGQCYIVSVGPRDAGGAIPDKAALVAGLAKVGQEDEPTLIVIPEAVELALADWADVVTAALTQCGKLMDRFAIIDVRAGGDSTVTSDDAAKQLRDNIGMSNLKYGAAYYPFVVSTLSYEARADGSNVTVVIDGGAAVGLATLASKTTQFNFVKAALQNGRLTLPPSGAVAGVYANTDGTRGVWKAPANVSLADVIAPAIALDNDRQDTLNVDVDGGKSINAIRAFAGKGTLVWGARTLAGNDNEWRYISVRRFFNMVEESVKKATYWAVFEPNDANTWVKVRGMIENYLIDKWRDGALAGATPKEAFFVKCGLGITMNSQDILEGRMHVEIGMAVVRPAEFIVLKFSHKMQTS